MKSNYFKKENLAMDFMADEELDGYLVLILFMLKRKKSLSSKKPQKILVKGNIQRESSGRTLQQFST